MDEKLLLLIKYLQQNKRYLHQDFKPEYILDQFNADWGKEDQVYVQIDKEWEPDDEPFYKGTQIQMMEQIFCDQKGGAGGYKIITIEEWEKMKKEGY